MIKPYHMVTARSQEWVIATVFSQIQEGSPQDF